MSVAVTIISAVNKTDGTYHQVKKPLCETECEICYILSCFAVPLCRNTCTYKNNATSTKALLSKIVQKPPTVYQYIYNKAKV